MCFITSTYTPEYHMSTTVLQHSFTIDCHSPGEVILIQCIMVIASVAILKVLLEVFCGITLFDLWIHFTEALFRVTLFTKIYDEDHVDHNVDDDDFNDNDHTKLE